MTIGVLAKLAERGEIGADESVVVYITGEGLKTLDAARESFHMHEIEPTLEAFEREFEAAEVRRSASAPLRSAPAWRHGEDPSSAPGRDRRRG